MSYSKANLAKNNVKPKNVMDYIHEKHSIFNAKKSKTVMTMIKKGKKAPNQLKIY